MLDRHVARWYNQKSRIENEEIQKPKPSSTNLTRRNMSRAATARYAQSRDGYTGGLFEREVVGKCQWNGIMEYFPRKQTMDMVRELQPWDPSDPGPSANSLPNNFHASIAEALGVEDWSEVRLYTAVGSPLDKFHSMDAFVEFRGQVVTIDLTLNRLKGEYRADITVDFEDIFDRLRSTACKIAAMLRCNVYEKRSLTAGSGA